MICCVLCPCCGREVDVPPLPRTVCPECGSEFLTEAGIAYRAVCDEGLFGISRPATSGDPDFEIEDGVLTAYRGKGGRVRVPQGVRIIGTQAFGGCAALTAVDLPEGLVEVGEGAFARCTALAEVAFPASIERVSADAFARCMGLRSVRFAPGTDASRVCIDEDAFYCCGALEHVEGWDGELLV